jgi:hypothetical protein
MKSKPYLQGKNDWIAGMRNQTKNPYKFGSKANIDWQNAQTDCYNKSFNKIMKRIHSLSPRI